MDIYRNPKTHVTSGAIPVPKSIVKLFIFLFFVSVSHFTFNIENCEAQWEQCSSIWVGSISSFAVNGNNIFAGAYNNPPGSGGVYLSTNNGTSWTQIALISLNVTSLAANGNNIFAGADGGGVFLSTNNGTTWVQTNYYNNLVSSLAILGNNVYAGTMGGTQGVYLSTNNGSTWTLTALQNISVFSLATHDNDILAGAAGTPDSGIYRSSNNGTNWTYIGLNNKFVFSLATSGSNIFAGTINNPAGPGGVYLSTNNGTSWAQTTLNNKDVRSLVASGNNIFAGTHGYGVFFSTNNGTNWIEKNQGFFNIPRVFALLVTNNYIFAGTEGYSVWRRPLSDFTGLQIINVEIPASYSLKQNYPNPFNPSTKIRYELPRAGVVKLVVFDALGHEVETLVNEKQSAGTYEATFDGSQYPSGVYFARLEAGSYNNTIKMLMLK